MTVHEAIRCRCVTYANAVKPAAQYGQFIDNQFEHHLIIGSLQVLYHEIYGR